MSGPWADRNVAWVDYDAAWQPRTARAPLGRAGGAFAVRAAASMAAAGAGLDPAVGGLTARPVLPGLAAVVRPGRAAAAGRVAPVRAVVAASALIRSLAGLFVLKPCRVGQPASEVARLASPVATKARLAASVTPRAQAASPATVSARLVSAVKLQQP